MFNKNSVLVKAWVNLIKKGAYTCEDVPAVSNLQEVVYEVLNETE